MVGGGHARPGLARTRARRVARQVGPSGALSAIEGKGGVSQNVDLAAYHVGKIPLTLYKLQLTASAWERVLDELILSGHPQRVCRRSGGTWSIFSMSCAGVGPSARRVACAVKCARRMALPAKRASVVLRLGLFGIRGRDHLTSCWYGDRKGQCRIKKPSMSARCRTQRQDVDEAARASKHQNIGLKVPRSSAFRMAQRPAPPCPVWATTT